MGVNAGRELAQTVVIEAGMRGRLYSRSSGEQFRSMRDLNSWGGLTALAILVTLATGCGPGEPPTTEVELAENMALMQRWTDKAGRAGAAENWVLADFYLHELEEAAGELIDAEVVYEGHQIGELVKTMLEPAIESLEEAVTTRDAAMFTVRYETMIATCNACHVTTEHGYVRLAAPDLSINPWAQDFRPAP